MIYRDLLYKAAQKVDWRKVGRFLSHPSQFDEETFRQSLLSWLRSLRFYDEGMTEDRIRLKILALFNYLWESNRDAFPNDAVSWPRDTNTNSDVGFYSILPLLYYETSMWSAPRFFWGEDGCAADDIRRREPGALDHEMLGVMSNVGMYGGYGTFDITSPENSEVLKHLQRHQWVRPCPLEPAPVLGLSFHANGLENILRGELSCVLDRQTFLDMSGWAIWFSHGVAHSDWTARYLMFILAQRLFLFQNVKDPAKSLERWLFALLYLRFYKEGPDGCLGRPSLLKEWHAISRGEKEDEAAASRRIFIETCNWAS